MIERASGIALVDASEDDKERDFLQEKGPEEAGADCCIEDDGGGASSSMLARAAGHVLVDAKGDDAT
jgi:hypothetical protein